MIVSGWEVQVKFTFWLSFYTVNWLLFKITELKKPFIKEKK